MTTLTTERLVELRDRLSGQGNPYKTYYVCDVHGRVASYAEKDIIAALTRLIEVESENVRLQVEIDANAWSISPAMAQATIEQHWERIQKLQAELAAIKAEVGPEPEQPTTGGDEPANDWTIYWIDRSHHYKHRAEHLAARNAELVTALKPFAALLQPHNDNGPDVQPVFQVNGAVITLGDLRKAQQEQP